MRRALLLTAVLTAVAWRPVIAGPGSASGPITVDSTTFVPGTSVMGTDGGVYGDNIPPVKSTTTAAFRMTKYRAEHVNLRDNSGVEIGTVGNPINVTGGTTVTLTTVTVNNSSFSVSGSTVTIMPSAGANIPVSISGTPSVSVSNSPTVFLATTSVSGSTVTLSNSNLNVTVTNTPNVLVVSTPAVKINGAVPVGANNIGTVSGSSVTVTNPITITNTDFDVTGSTVNVNVNGTVPVSGTFFPATQPVYLVNPSTTSVTGIVSVTGSTVTVNGIVTALPSGTQNVYLINAATTSVTGVVQTYVTNPTTTTVSGSLSVTGSTVTITNAGFNVTNTPSVNIANVPLAVQVNNAPNVYVTNPTTATISGKVDVTGSTVGINGVVNAVFSGTAAVSVINTTTITFNGVSQPVTAAQSGTWLNTIQVLNSGASPTSVGYSGGATQLPAAITDGVLVASMTQVAGKNGLNVNIIGGAGAGGTSSNYTASFPTAGNAAGYVGPTGLMQAAAVDVSSNVLVNVVSGVSGSTVTVNGSVNAMISGTPTVSVSGAVSVSGSTVSISGTPNVTVTNTPNVSVTNTPSVSVTNTVGTTLTAQLPTGTNNIGTVTGSTVNINGDISATISGTVNTYQLNPSTVTVSGTVPVSFASTVNTYQLNPATVTITGTPSVYVSNPTTATVSGSVSITGTPNIYVTNPTTATVSGTVAATQSGSWSVTDTQSSSRWNVSFDTRTTTAVISSTGVTTNVAISTPIAGLSSQTVRVFRLVLTADAATTITFRDGSTNFGDSQYLAANGSIVLDLSNEPWYITSSSNGFVIKQSGSANIGVRIWYTQS